MPLDAAAAERVAREAREAALAAGCGGAEASWLGGRAAAEATAQAAAERGAEVDVVAEVALAAAKGSGVGDGEAERAKSRENGAVWSCFGMFWPGFRAKRPRFCGGKARVGVPQARQIAGWSAATAASAQVRL